MAAGTSPGRAELVADLDRLTAESPSPSGNFGGAVAVSQHVAAIGAPRDGSAAFGAGSVTVLSRSGDTWLPGDAILPEVPQGGASFGHALDLSGDRIIVGAPYENLSGACCIDQGAAYIFERTGGGWAQVARLTAQEPVDRENFGISVALEGNLALVGAWENDSSGGGSGAAYLFQRNLEGWQQVAQLLPDDPAPFDQFGVSVDLDGARAIVGAWGNDDHGTNSGSAYIFGIEDASWQQQAKLLPELSTDGGRFGGDVALSRPYAVVGAAGDATAAPGAGAAYLFEEGAEAWSPLQTLTVDQPMATAGFGSAVSVDGDRVLVGLEHSTGAGAAHLFERQGGSWSASTVLSSSTLPGSLFGSAVALDGDVVLIGARGEDAGAGAAYLGEVDDFAEIDGRYVYYRNSAFHPTPLDVEGAIATDKVPLLPGGTATVDHYTSYVRGINGIVVDVADLPGSPTLADFVFKTGNTNSPETWTAAPPAEELAIVTGGGRNATDRIIIAWPDGSITNSWLEVTVLANPNTGLVEDDVFYFGNAVGEGTGTLGGRALVDPADELGARNNLRGFANPAAIENPYDYNRDRMVDVIDQLLARNNPTGFLDSLRMISGPALVEPSAGIRSVHAVPEPAAVAHLAAGGLALLFALLARARHRRRQ
ncbi:MAG: hypothetical protein WDZ59_07195 [Pirellulales bacterium]